MPMDRIINVGQTERWVSVAGGSLLALAGLRRPSMGGALMALAGGVLVARGLTGHCPVYRMLREGLGRPELLGRRPDLKPYVGERAARDVRPFERQPGDIFGPTEPDIVDEASEESFPASDPPSFTPTRT